MFFNRRIPFFMREAYYYDSLGIIAPFLGVALMHWIDIRSVFIISFCLIAISSLIMFLSTRYPFPDFSSPFSSSISDHRR